MIGTIISDRKINTKTQIKIVKALLLFGLLQAFLNKFVKNQPGIILLIS